MDGVTLPGVAGVVILVGFLVMLVRSLGRPGPSRRRARDDNYDSNAPNEPGEFPRHGSWPPGHHDGEA
jgi:hypothetical protein